MGTYQKLCSHVRKFCSAVNIVASPCFFVCLFGVFRPTQEYFTNMEKSPLPMEGCKLWPMLGTYGRRSVRLPQRFTPTVTRGIRL